MAYRKIYQKTNFLGGEAGFYLEGRSDLPQYAVGASKLLNFVGLPGGGVARRPPTNFVKSTRSNKPGVLIPFVGSNNRAMIISITYDAGVTEWESIDVSTNIANPMTVIDPLPVGIATTWGEDFQSIQYAQSADVLFLVSTSGRPLVVQGSGGFASVAPYDNLSNALSANGAEDRVPYRPSNIFPSHTMTPSATSGAITLTSSDPFFESGNVGSIFRITHGATSGYVGITGFISATQVNGLVLFGPLGATTATDDWAESAWSDRRGWPRTITIYNQRLVFGGNESQPDTIWASQSSDFFEMNTKGSFAISNALSFTLASNRLNEINWMLGGKKLTIGTSSSEWVGEFVEDGTNLRVQFNEETAYGSKYIQAQKVGGSIPFVHRSGRKIRELFFSDDESNYKAIDLTIFANHVGHPFGKFVDSNTSIIRIAQQESPFNVLWAIDNVGRMWSLTRDRDQQIAIWCSHQIGGVGPSGQDYPSMVTSICSVPSPDNTHDRLYLIVRRLVDGVDSYHIEYIGNIEQHKTISAQKCHLDSAVRVTGAAATVWGGFSHLANETVYCVAMGPQGVGTVVMYAGEIAVDGAGQVTLPNQATDVVVGILQNAEIRTLPLDNGGNPEVLGGTIRRPDQMVIRLHQSYGVKIGEARKYSEEWGTEENNSNFEPIPMGNVNDAIVNSKIFTGVVKVNPPMDYSREAAIGIICDTPWPCTVLSIDTRLVVNEV